MTRLTPADQLAALMRVQIANLRRGAPAKSGARVRTSSQPAPAVGSRTDPAALAAERIRAIPPDDPARESKALRAFLECVFISELGADLVRDAGFAQMVDHVQRQMEADPRLAEAASQAARALLESAHG